MPANVHTHPLSPLASPLEGLFEELPVTAKASPALQKAVGQGQANPSPQQGGVKEGGSRIAALWVADLPTWALSRLQVEVSVNVPVVAVSGERVVGTNSAARKRGIHKEEGLSRAKQLAPDLQVYAHDPPAMLAAWDGLVTMAYSYSPWIEEHGEGWLWLGGVREDEAQEMARETASRVGLANSRSTAQIAALAAREGSARIVKDERAFIAQIPVRYLLGLGFAEEMVVRLKLFGVEHLADVHRLKLSRKQLEAQFKGEGVRLYQIAHGELTQPVQRYHEPLVASAQHEFEEPAVEPFQYLPYLNLLVAQVALELQNKVCWTIKVTAKYRQGMVTRSRVLGAATNKPTALLRVAELTLKDGHRPGEGIEVLEVSLSRIELAQARQFDLFGVLDRPMVQKAIERVDQRFQGGIGRLQILPQARFHNEAWRYIPLGPSQARQIGVGRTIRFATELRPFTNRRLW